MGWSGLYPGTAACFSQLMERFRDRRQAGIRAAEELADKVDIQALVCDELQVRSRLIQQVYGTDRCGHVICDNADDRLQKLGKAFAALEESGKLPDVTYQFYIIFFLWHA